MSICQAQAAGIVDHIAVVLANEAHDCEFTPLSLTGASSIREVAHALCLHLAFEYRRLKPATDSSEKFEALVEAVQGAAFFVLRVHPCVPDITLETILKLKRGSEAYFIEHERLTELVTTEGIVFTESPKSYAEYLKTLNPHNDEYLALVYARLGLQQYSGTESKVTDKSQIRQSNAEEFLSTWRAMEWGQRYSIGWRSMLLCAIMLILYYTTGEAQLWLKGSVLADALQWVPEVAWIWIILGTSLFAAPPVVAFVYSLIFKLDERGPVDEGKTEYLELPSSPEFTDAENLRRFEVDHRQYGKTGELYRYSDAGMAAAQTLAGEYVHKRKPLNAAAVAAIYSEVRKNHSIRVEMVEIVCRRVREWHGLSPD